MCRKRLDMREQMPSGMEEYLSMYGWHFNKRLCEYAISRMYKEKNGNKQKFKMLPKEEIDSLFNRYGIETSGFNGYDGVYVYHMALADFMGSSITDEAHLVQFVKDYLCDSDGYDEVALTRFYADCIGKGEVLSWEDFL